MSGTSDVDVFVRRNVLPQHRDVVEKLRQIMREAAPDATEEIAYRIPMWRRRRIFVFLNPTKKDITFGFSRGREFEDRYGLLRGAQDDSVVASDAEVAQHAAPLRPLAVTGRRA